MISIRSLWFRFGPWISVPLASSALGNSNPAGSDGDRGTLEEVIVTAEKHREDLERVPLSIQVLTESQLNAHDVSSFNDYARLLPNVSYLSLGPGQTQVFFRGINTGGETLHAGTLPTTGVYLDEIPVTTIGSLLDVHMYDISRVEALDGPQGTLFGASSLSGTLRIITNAPDAARFSAGYDVKLGEFEHGNAGTGVQGFINLPLNDRAAIRLVGYFAHDGGYINNVRTSHTIGFGVPAAGIPDTPVSYSNLAAVESRFNPVDTYGGRAALKIDLDDRWTVTPKLLAQGQRAKGDFLVDPKLGDLNVADYTQPGNRDRWYQAALTVEGKFSNLDAVYAGGLLERHVDNMEDYSAYTIGYDEQAHFPDASYNAVRLFNPDGTLVANPLEYVVNHDHYQKTSHEVRVSSPPQHPLRATVGLFYQRQSDDIRAEFRIHDLPEYYAVDGAPNVYYLTQQTRIDRDYAAFTDMSYNVSRRLTLSAGIRKFWVNNTLYGFFGYGLAGGSTSGELSCDPPVSPSTIISNYRPCVNTDKKVVENGETHRINLAYQIDTDRMVYFQYSTGFRPGGNNRRVGIAPYGPDSLINVEIGAKTSWLGNRLRVNGSLYSDRWKGVQQNVVGDFGIESIVNVGDARSKGVEADISWSPTSNWLFAASGTYSTARTLENFCALDPATEVVTHDCANPATPSGSRLPVSPRIKANGSIRYGIDLFGYEAHLQTTAVHQGSVAAVLGGTLPETPADLPHFTTFDFSAGIGKHGWTWEAFVENAFDERGVLGAVVQCVTYYCLRNYRVYVVAPMNFGIRFSQRF
jgi:iron complex outermembrane recepter protein